MRSLKPYIIKNRSKKLSEIEEDLTLNASLSTKVVGALRAKLDHLAQDILPSQTWRENVISGSWTSGLQQVEEDPPSRHWIGHPPIQRSGRDYARAVHLRTHNLATAALPYSSMDQRQCKGGCQKSETINHVLQQCPLTH